MQVICSIPRLGRAVCGKLRLLGTRAAAPSRPWESRLVRGGPSSSLNPGRECSRRLDARLGSELCDLQATWPWALSGRPPGPPWPTELGCTAPRRRSLLR
eukprot:8837864-Pyramimonas_sp.AAC.2